MSGDTTPIIAMLAAAVAALWSFSIWIFRQTLARADKRIDVLEEREQETLKAVVTSLATIQAMVSTTLETFKEFRLSRWGDERRGEERR